jgi:5'-nucleotidase
MAVHLDKTLVIGVSSRALFHLEDENTIFNNEGVEGYTRYQKENEDKPLEKGTGFYLIESLLNLNKHSEERLVEVIVMSRNSPETGLRVLNSIDHYNLDITRSAFSGGVPLHNYIDAFNVDLFLSKSEADVQAIIDSGACAAALIYSPPKEFVHDNNVVRIAFDADAVLFSDESELIYKTKGIEAFMENEIRYTDTPLKEGPFARLIKTLSVLQRKLKEVKSGSECPLRIAIVTARSGPAHKRLIKTLRIWGVEVDEAFFLGGVPKDKILKAFNAHIFFDDQDVHLKPSEGTIPVSRVPYRSNSPLKDLVK